MAKADHKAAYNQLPASGRRRNSGVSRADSVLSRNSGVSPPKFAVRRVDSVLRSDSFLPPLQRGFPGKRFYRGQMPQNLPPVGPIVKRPGRREGRAARNRFKQRPPKLRTSPQVRRGRPQASGSFLRDIVASPLSPDRRCSIGLVCLLRSWSHIPAVSYHQCPTRLELDGQSGRPCGLRIGQRGRSDLWSKASSYSAILRK